MGYPREVYEQAWAQLDLRRNTARRQLERNHQEVRHKFPEVADIHRKMMETGSSITMAVVHHPQNAGQLIQKLAEANLALQKRREEILSEAGYSSDFLLEKFTCKDCSDTGYQGVDMCHCFKDLLKQQAFNRLSHMSDAGKLGFENFSLDYYSNQSTKSGVSPRGRMSEIFEFCKVYAKEFSKSAPSLLMMGRTGLGKTHLSLGIAWHITREGFGVVYTPVQKLMDTLEADKFSYNSDAKENYAQNMNSVLKCNLLVLDDLGTEFVTSFSKSLLYNIVNTRMIEGRPTIINTNLDLQGLEKMYDQRMASRLGFGYKILPFLGEDIRYIKRTRGQ